MMTKYVNDNKNRITKPNLQFFVSRALQFGMKDDEYYCSLI